MTIPSEIYNYFKDDEVSILLSGHRLYYWIEYTIYPTILFILIYLIARKEEKSPFFYGIKRSTEIISKNWIELSITFICSWLLFEFRLYLEGNKVESQQNLQLFFPSRIFSIFSFLLLMIVFLSYILFITISKTKQKKDEHAIAIPLIKFSLIPFILFINLWSCTLFYEFPILRFVWIIIGFGFGFIYFRRESYTSYYWFTKAVDGKNDKEKELSSLQYLIRSYDLLGFNISESHDKYIRVLSCHSKCEEISGNGISRRSNKPFDKLVIKTEKRLVQSINKANLQGDPLLSLLTKAKESLLRIS